MPTMTHAEALHIIERYCDDPADLDMENFKDSMSRMIRASKRGTIPTLRVDSGCTKGVIIFEDADFVVKIPFTTYCGEFFQRAESASRWDYCQREVEIYEAAERFDCSCFLAKSEYIGEINGHPIYAQERITNIGDYTFWYSYKYGKNTSGKVQTQARRLSDANTTYLAGFCNDVIGNMIAAYGFRRTQRFMNLCVREHTGRDWHSGNYGTTMNTDAIIFCDYSGFRD